ncbi:unnamed protein product [Phytomonas sp. EM1]|nr:unnamed protein product [Phytomonas sp. EM1]|eukprot:CCW63149.1 unnamed protein product [Phytomonas sp. isolate EM1]
MISFKKIAEFLKKVGSRDTSAPSGKDAKNAKNTSNATTEVPSAFADKSIPVSNVLRGLPPNASKQAVLLHIQAMVEKRFRVAKKSRLFFTQDKFSRRTSVMFLEAETLQRRVSSSIISLTGDALIKGSSPVAQDSEFGNATAASPCASSHHQHQENVGPTLTDTSARHSPHANSVKGGSGSLHGELTTPASTTVGAAEGILPLPGQVEDINALTTSLDQERAELIEALDVCLQEVPEMDEMELHEHIRQCIAKRDAGFRSGNRSPCPEIPDTPFHSSDLQSPDVAHSMKDEQTTTTEDAHPCNEIQGSDGPANDENVGVVDPIGTQQSSSHESHFKSDSEIVTIYEWRQLLLSLVELLIYTESDILYQQAFYTQRKGEEQENIILVQQLQQIRANLLPAAAESDTPLPCISPEKRGGSQQQVRHASETPTAAVDERADAPSSTARTPPTGPAQHQPPPPPHGSPVAARATPLSSADTTAKVKAAEQEMTKSINKVLSSACSLATWIVLRSMLQQHILRLETSAMEALPSQEAGVLKPSDRVSEEKDKESGKFDSKSTESSGVMAAAAVPSQRKVLTVDWPEVVSNLRELLYPFGPSMAECVLCASFLRDDGLELMMCMLQEPYARALIEPILTSDERRRQQGVFLNRGHPSGANPPEGGVVHAPNPHLPAGNASGGGGSGSGSGGGGAKSAAGPSAIFPPPGRGGLGLPPPLLVTTPAPIPDGPTLDDLLAEVELAYKEGVLKSWAEYLKHSLYVRDDDDGRSAVGASVAAPIPLTTATQVALDSTEDKTAKSSWEMPSGTQAQDGSITTIDCGSTSEECDLKGLLLNVNDAVICQLATAFFFCSDEWKSECRKARFAFLHFCMHKSAQKRKAAFGQGHVVASLHVNPEKPHPLPIEDELPLASKSAEGFTTNHQLSTFAPEDDVSLQNSSKNAAEYSSLTETRNLLEASGSPELVNIICESSPALPSTLSFALCNPCATATVEPGTEGSAFLKNVNTTKAHHSPVSFSSRSIPGYQPEQPTLYSVGKEMLARITKMSWAAALHKRVEHCITDQTPALEVANAYAREERQVSGMLSNFRARQRALNSILKSHLSAGRSHEALAIANRHFKNERKEWSSRAQTIFSAMQYLQSMVQLVQAQAACHAYGAVIETGQFVLLQCSLCEQMLQVISPKPRGAFILRFGNPRVKLLNTKVYLTRELWYSYAMFNNHARAEKLFDECIKNILQLRKKLREDELFDALMKRGKQLMNMKEFHSAVELFKQAVNISAAALKTAPIPHTGGGMANPTNPNPPVGGGAGVAGVGPPPNNPPIPPLPPPTSGNAACDGTSGNPSGGGGGGGGGGAALPVPANARVASTAFSVNLHLHRAGSSDPSSADEHPPIILSRHDEAGLELAWRAAESQRMLALAFVTQAEHEVNVQARRVQLSNAVNNAYASQASLQRWQANGGTPKRMLTAVPSSLIVIAKALLLLGQPKKAALLLEPLIETKPNAVSAWPPMWAEILDPTTEPLTAEDIALRIYVNSVRIAVFQLYGQCLSKFDGERALRVVERTRALLHESFYWMHVVRKKICAKPPPKMGGNLSFNSSSKQRLATDKGPLGDSKHSDPVVGTTSPEIVREVDYLDGIENRFTDIGSQAPSNPEEGFTTVDVPNLTNMAHPPQSGASVQENLQAMENIPGDTQCDKVKDLFERINVYLGSKSERVTALRALRSGRLDVRKAHCEFEITAGDTLSLLGRWEDALEAYFRTLVICMNEDEAAAEAAKRGRSVSGRGGGGHTTGATASVGTDTTRPFVEHSSALDLELLGELSQEFEEEEEEEEVIKGIGSMNLSTSTGAKDLRAVMAREEHMKYKVCENMALSRIANVYKALDNPKIAIHYLKPVLEYAKESNNALLEYQSMLSLSRLYTITEAHELAQEMWERVSAFAKQYGDKEVSRETMRNIVTVQEAAKLFPDVIRTAEELRQLASAAEGSDATADLRYALEALANAHLELEHYKECIEALDEREKVQEKSGEWSGKLLELRARARLGNGDTTEAIKILSTWVNKAKQLQNWSELGKANRALGAAYIIKGDAYAAHRYHLAALQSFSLLKGDIAHQDKLCVIESARWLVHNYYLNDDKMQVDVELPQPENSGNTPPGVDEHATKKVINASIFSGGGEVYENGLHNHSGDLDQILEEDEKMRSGSGLIENDPNYLTDDNINTFLDSIQNHSFVGMNMYLDKSKDTSARTSGTTFPADINVPFNKPESNSGELSPRESTTPSSIGNMSDGDGVRANTDSPINFELAPQPEGTDKEARTPAVDREGRAISHPHHVDGEPPLNPSEERPRPSLMTPARALAAAPSMTSTNVSMCSRLAAAMAGTDVLNAIPGPDGHGGIPTGKPTTSSGGGARSTGAFLTPLLPEVFSNPAEQRRARPSTVSTLCYYLALQTMEWMTGLLCGACMFPHCRSVIPYSPAERVDLALLTHPRCVFVFFFAEYVTESSSSYDVIIRPANHVHFMHRYAQVTTLKEYCDKKLLTRVAKKAAKQVATGTDGSLTSTLDRTTKTVPLNLTTELLSGEIPSRMESMGCTNKKSSAACESIIGGNASGVSPAILERVLEDETRTQLEYLYDELWRPVQSSFHRTNLKLSDAECLIIVADPSLWRVPFHALLPNPENLFPGESSEPLGQQVTLVVTPSVAHLVQYGVSRREQIAPSSSSASTLNPPHKRQKIIFLPEEEARANNRNPHLLEPEQPPSGAASSPSGGEIPPPLGDQRPSLTAESLAEGEGEDPFAPLRSEWAIHAGCTRKELLHAFADSDNRVIMALNTPVDDRLKVADGVIGLRDLASARAREAGEGEKDSKGGGGAAAGGGGGGGCAAHGLQHLRLLVMTVDRGVSASVTEPAGALSLCLKLRCPRALLLDVITGTAINAMHKEFLVLYLSHLEVVERWEMKFPYALALRMTLGKVIERGWPVTVWGAFTLIGAP